MFIYTGCEDKNEVVDNKEAVGDLLSNLTEDKNGFTVIVPKDYSETEEYAASEICKYFYDVTGTKITWTPDTGYRLSNEDTYISIGYTQLYIDGLRKHGLVDLSKETLNEDGFNIFSIGFNVFISSYNDRGILYGAYQFIEETLGVKFVSQDYTYIPKKDKVLLYEYDKTYVPIFPQRAYLNYAVFYNDYDYVAHMRYNTDYCIMPSYLGGSTKWVQLGNPAHTFPTIVNISSYMDSDGNVLDEYIDCFGHEVVNGKKVIEYDISNNWDLCYTSGVNEDGTLSDDEYSAAKLVIQNIEKLLEKDTDSEFIMLGQADRSHGCPCERCLAARNKYLDSGLMIRFVNLVSREIQKWLNENQNGRVLKYTLFAYQYDEFAPIDEKGDPLDSTVVPDDNIYIKYAPIKSIRYYSLNDDRQNDDTRGIFYKWKNICNHFMAWTYHTDFGEYFWYYPTIQVFPDMLSQMKEMNLEYEFAQGNYQEPTCYQQWLDSYVFSKLCWNIDTNVRDLRNEFLYYYFGEEAYEDMVKFHDEIDAHYAYLSATGANLITGGKAFTSLNWPINLINRWVSYYEDALEITQSSTKYTQEEKDVYYSHIEMSSLSIKYMRVYNGKFYEEYSEDDVKSLALEWVDLAEKYGTKITAENTAKSIDYFKKNYGVD